MLLKNNNRVLPLSKTVKVRISEIQESSVGIVFSPYYVQKVALIGPIGNATTGLEGDYGSISFPVVSMQAGKMTPRIEIGRVHCC